MTGFLLVIFISNAGGEAVSVSPIGVIFDPAMCEIIGEGLSSGLRASAPTAKVEFDCIPQVGGDA